MRSFILLIVLFLNFVLLMAGYCVQSRQVLVPRAWLLIKSLGWGFESPLSYAHMLIKVHE